MLVSLTSAYRLIPQFYPVLEELKEECLGEIKKLEEENSLISRQKDYRKLHKDKYVHATKKLHSCIAACDRLKESLKVLDLFVNGGL